MSGRNLRFINTLILVVFCILALSGLYGLVWPFPSFLFEIHRITGWAVILLIPWKIIIALRSLRRGLNRHFDRNILVILSILLSIAVIAILVLALMWTWQIGPYYVWIAGSAYSGIGWHWGIALGLAPLFILHVWRGGHESPAWFSFARRRPIQARLALGQMADRDPGGRSAIRRPPVTKLIGEFSKTPLQSNPCTVSETIFLRIACGL